MSKFRLIGVAGKARTGKDTIGGYLKQDHGFHSYAFADPIKHAACQLFGITMEAFDDQWKEKPFYFPPQALNILLTKRDEVIKNVVYNMMALTWKDLYYPDEPTSWGYSTNQIIKMFGDFFFQKIINDEVIEFGGYITPRRIAQLIGTEGGRDLFDRDIWVKRAQMEMNRLGSNSNGMVITDVRFPNEVEWVKDNGGEIWHTFVDEQDKFREGDSDETIHQHESEQGLEISPEDQVIMNNGTLEDLKNSVEMAYSGKLKDRNIIA